ncbi:hypothetical protein [Luteococcus sp. OSA5]|uniref:hypothetical protein n=1 Tax=Luteococcus sp. OSA5 TaxID=3401630 RepID=UPI003B438254
MDMTRSSARRARLAASLGVLALLGCSAPGTPVPEDPTTSQTQTTSATPTPAPTRRDASQPRQVPMLWESKTSLPASDVVNVAGRAILMASTKRGLEVQNLDLGTGRVNWAHKVTASLVPPNHAMSVVAVKNRYIAILEPLTGPGGRARLRLLDVEKQGQAIADTGIYVFTSFPELCDDDSEQVCVKALKGNKPVEVRLGWRGTRSERAMPDVGDSYQDLGAHGLVRFLDPKTREASIGVEKGGKLVWSRPERDIFGRLSPEAGWVFRSHGKVIYGSVMLPRATINDPMPQRRLTIGIDRTNGKTMWRLPGADLSCNARRDVELVCEWQAGIVRRDGTVERGRMVVSRINPRTGERMWSTRPLFVQGEAAGQLGTSGEGVVAVETKERTWIDAVTGHVRPAEASDITWARRAVQVPSDQVSFKGSTKVNTRRAVVNSTASNSVPERFFEPLPPGTGANFGTLRVLSLPGRVIALNLA